MFQVITDLSRPFDIQPRALQTTPPTASELAAGSAASAQAIADSAAAVARAAAGLGDGEAGDAVRAQVLWEENLKQIARVQELYGLPPLPFQTS